MQTYDSMFILKVWSEVYAKHTTAPQKTLLAQRAEVITFI